MAKRFRFIELVPTQVSGLTGFMNEMVLKGNLQAYRRGRAVELSAKYQTVPEIAEALKSSKRRVYEWLRRYQKYGLSGIAQRVQPGKLTSGQIDEIMKISGWSRHLVSGQKAWSFRKIAKWINDTWHIKISYVRIRQIITGRLWNKT